MTETLPSYLSALNPEQREAVLHEEKSLLILAGAGSGKTRVITTKIAYLIRERGIDPRSILAVTFTNKAAREMAERAAAIESRAAYAMLRTFHSFGAWFLRRYARLAGLNPSFTIYDDDDMASLLSSICGEKSKADIKLLSHQISRAKDYFISPDDPEIKIINYKKEFQTIYKRYEERLAEIGNADFGDLIKKPVEILRNNPDVAAEIRGRFRVVMIDEYQDTNIAQFTLLKELCGADAYVCVVGDDDQSIYRFRGAEVRNILEFPERFPHTDIIRLERNYRSTAPILRVASSVVDNNKGRLGKTLTAERGGGKTPVLAFLPNQDEEAHFAASLIERYFADARSDTKRAADKQSPVKKYSDWAILYRTNAQSLGFETELLRRHIPYRVVGSLKFYEREEIKDALALLSFLANPRDEVSFRRVVNKPARGLGDVAVGRVITEAAGGDLFAAARRTAPILSAKARSGLQSFTEAVDAGRAVLANFALWDDPTDGAALADAAMDLFEDADDGASPQTEKAGRKSRKKASPAPDAAANMPTTNAPAVSGNKKTKDAAQPSLRSGEGLSVCVVTLVQSAGLAAYHLTHDEIAGNQRIANLQELANAASLYPATGAGLIEFLEHIDLDRSMEEQNATDGEGVDSVTLITLHNTKGLEFKRVIITGVEQGVFPRDDKKDDDLEEERRLFYVGATRAMDELYFTCCAARRMFGQTALMEPSLFLSEIDKSALRVIGQPPYGFSARPAAGAFQHSTSQRGVASRKRGRQSGDEDSAGDSSTGTFWKMGDRVFSDDNGYGFVTEIRPHATGPIVVVLFDTGKEMSFLSRHQSSKITKISGEDHDG